MKKLLLLLLIILNISKCEDDYQEDLDVIILNDENFDKAIEKFKTVLVLFYAPWCGHCKKFLPEFAKAAGVLKKDDIVLAKIDTTVNSKIRKRFNIKGYPTTKLFINGKIIPYEEGRYKRHIVAWMKRKTGKNIQTINNLDDAETFFKDQDVAIIYCGNDKNSLEQFKLVSMINEDFVFGSSNDKEVADKYQLKNDTITLFKTFDEKRSDFNGPINEKDVLDFIEKKGVHKILPWDELTMSILFRKMNPSIFLFADKNNNKKYKEYNNIMENVYNKIGNEVKLILMGVKEQEEKRFSDWIGLRETDIPVVMLGDPRNGFLKYKMEGLINEENIINFYNKWKDNKLKIILKSEDIPKENNGPVYKIVSDSFKKEVLNNDKDVLVKFYAPWCIHCQELAPIYIELANKLKKYNDKLLIAEADATANEFEGVDVRSFPTIKFWPGKNKKNPIDFNDDLTLNGFMSFLKKHSSHGINDGTTSKKNEKVKGDL